MPKTLIISDEAVIDLEDIWDYIAKDSPPNADRFINRLYQKCLSLSELDGVGRSRDDLSPNLMSFPFKKYVIFFVRTQTELQIVRILYGSRDIEQIFEGI